MCRHAGFRWGGAGWQELTRSSGARSAGLVQEIGSLGCVVCVVFSLSVSLLFLFPLFAVLLNCPYPDPQVSACFFPFSSAARRGEGRPRGAFVAGRSQTITKRKKPVCYQVINPTTLWSLLFFCNGQHWVTWFLSQKISALHFLSNLKDTLRHTF